MDANDLTDNSNDSGISGLLGGIVNAAGQGAKSYFDSQAKPRAASAGPVAGRQPSWVMPAIVGGVLLVVGLILVMAVGGRR